MNIAIIGTGFTGLTAAYELLKKGHKVTLYEKSDKAGGLASGFRIENYPLEMAYHHLFRTDTDILMLAKDLGLEQSIEWHKSTVSIFIENKFFPFGGALDLLKFNIMPFIDRLRTGFTIFFLQKFRYWKYFINKPAFSWIKTWSGSKAYLYIWEPLLKGKFHKFYDKVSMAWLWARLHTRANSRRLMEGEKLGYPKGGFEVIVNKLIEEITSMGGVILFNSNISKIVSNEAGITIFFDSENLRTFKKYDKIIATIPSGVFAKLINTEQINEETKNYITKLESIEYLDAICMIFSTDQSLTQFYWNNINQSGIPFLAFINHTKLIDKSLYNGKYIYYLAGYFPNDHEFISKNESELKSLWFNGLKEVKGDFDESKVNEFYLFKFRNAQHIADLNYVNKIPEYKTPLKNIYLSNFSQIYPEDRGTNFAVREGKKIAEIAITDQ